MWTASVVTNDPLVGTNPEEDTFYGFHPDPGYDDWYGFFYGDYRGRPGDSSGWIKLLHERYPQHYHWNFVDNGWAVHGHVKQYIAYYNWTFGGQCGLGRYGFTWAPPYMADRPMLSAMMRLVGSPAYVIQQASCGGWRVAPFVWSKSVRAQSATHTTGGCGRGSAMEPSSQCNGCASCPGCISIAVSDDSRHWSSSTRSTTGSTAGCNGTRANSG